MTGAADSRDVLHQALSEMARIIGHLSWAVEQFVASKGRGDNEQVTDTLTDRGILNDNGRVKPLDELRHAVRDDGTAS